jgi:hypothetical protein
LDFERHLNHGSYGHQERDGAADFVGGRIRADRMLDGVGFRFLVGKIIEGILVAIRGTAEQDDRGKQSYRDSHHRIVEQHACPSRTPQCRAVVLAATVADLPICRRR